MIEECTYVNITAYLRSFSLSTTRHEAALIDQPIAGLAS